MPDSIEHPVVARKFTLADTAARGEWLAERLAARWPARSRAYWAGQIRSWISSNAYWLGCTERAVGLAMVTPEPMEGRLVVRMLALLMDDPREDEIHANRIVRAVESWAKDHRAVRVEIDPAVSDLPGGRLKTMAAAESVTLLVRYLEPER